MPIIRLKNIVSGFITYMMKKQMICEGACKSCHPCHHNIQHDEQHDCVREACAGRNGLRFGCVPVETEQFLSELSDGQKIFKGMEIIMKYDDKPVLEFCDDYLMFGRPVAQELFPEDAEYLKEYGWKANLEGKMYFNQI